MMYRQKFDTFIRIYDNVGYIVSKSDFGDRVTEGSGAVFLAALSRSPQTLAELVAKIAQLFTGVDRETLNKDAAEFYALLEEDGFIVSGSTPQELDAKDTRFSYSALAPKTLKTDFTPLIRRAAKSSQEYLEEHFKDKPQLFSFQIELTSRCNERCVHCYIPHENKISDIDPALFYDVLDQCRDMGILDLTLSGGEPMLHKNFCDFLRKAKEYDFSINILSNLTLLNNEIIADRDHILRLMANDIPLQISCPTMKQNKDSYIEVLNWAHDHKCRATTDYIMMARYDHSTDNLDNRLSLQEVEKIINDIIENDRDYQKEVLGQDFEFRDTRDRSNDIVCGVCVSSLCMIANGSVYPCAGWQDYVCGTITETPLRKLGEHSPKVQYLRSLRKKDFPQCTHCEDRGFCAMCMVRNANEDPEGNPLHINEHFCKVAALNRKIVLDWKAKPHKEQSAT